MRRAVRGSDLYLTVVTVIVFFFCQAEDGIRDLTVTGVQTCALPISTSRRSRAGSRQRRRTACSSKPRDRAAGRLGLRVRELAGGVPRPRRPRRRRDRAGHPRRRRRRAVCAQRRGRERRAHHALQRRAGAGAASPERRVDPGPRGRAGRDRSAAAGLHRGQVPAPAIRRPAARRAGGRRRWHALRRARVRPSYREAAGGGPARAGAGRPAGLLSTASPGTAPGYRGHRAVAGGEPGRRRGGRRAAPRRRGESAFAPAVLEAEVVIEAVREHLGTKQQVFAEVDRAAPADALLATNTSSLSVAAIAAAARDPGRVVGLHFFNPVHAMKLVEVVTHPQTTSQSVERAVTFAKALGKEPIVVKDSPGFASSRLGLALGLEAMRMLEEGVASAEDIDKAMELGYNHPMGPLKLTDLVGLDVRLAIAEYLHQTLKEPQFEPPQILRDKVAKGELGKKSGKGFYNWSA